MCIYIYTFFKNLSIILITPFSDLYPHYLLFYDVDMEHVGLLSVYTQGKPRLFHIYVA